MGESRGAHAGETRDTAVMGLVGDFLSDKFVPRDERVRLFRTWGSGIGMLPAGGPRNLTHGCAVPSDLPGVGLKRTPSNCFGTWGPTEDVLLNGGTAS